MLALSRAVVVLCALGMSAALGFAGCAPARCSRTLPTSYVAGPVFDAIVAQLCVQFPDDALAIKQLASPHRDAALRATSRAEERSAIFAMLEGIPSSHVALFSSHAKTIFERELLGQDSRMAGFRLARRGDHLAVSEVLTGGPADDVGLRRGDVVIRIGGRSPGEGAFLDPRTDDAPLPDLPAHLVKLLDDGPVAIDVVREGKPISLSITPRKYSSLRSDRASVRVVELGERRIGYLPLAYVYRHDTSAFVHDALSTTLDGCDALVLDLRGRGGSQIGMWALMSTFGGEKRTWKNPLVVLVDRETRSAKEVLADWLRGRGLARVIGERTIGATRPARLYRIDADLHLLCPNGQMSEKAGLEGSGVEPDVLVEDPWFDGDATGASVRDAILERGIEVAAAAAAAAMR